MKTHILILFLYTTGVLVKADELPKTFGFGSKSNGLQINSKIRASETNELYLTDDGYFIEDVISGNETSAKYHYDAIIAKAKMSRESLPAIDFGEGNWGIAQNGFQLSLRFERPDFTNGRPITAIVLVRNVTNQILQYFQIQMEVITASGQIFPEHQVPGGPTINSLGWRPLLPATQVKELISLDKEYDFTNGNYFVRAVLKDPTIKLINGKSVPSVSFTEVKSAEVKIKIENSP